MEDMARAGADMLGCAGFTDADMVTRHAAVFKEAQDDARKLGIKSVDECGNIPSAEWAAPWLTEEAGIQKMREADDRD